MSAKRSDGGRKKKVRKKVPAKTADAVKAKFRHRCALCRSNQFQLHHIDEDPSNNIAANLIPLCPNCHHGRVHGNAGYHITADALRLYRDLGNRFVTTGSYDLLLRRFGYLTSGGYASMEWRALYEAYEDLVTFVRGLKHGEHFDGIVRRKFAPPRLPSGGGVMIIDETFDVARHRRARALEHAAEIQRYLGHYRNELDKRVAAIPELLDEILMAQDPPL